MFEEYPEPMPLHPGDSWLEDEPQDDWQVASFAYWSQPENVERWQ